MSDESNWRYLFYRLDARAVGSTPAVPEPPGYSWTYWRPAPTRIAPAEVSTAALVWWVMHQLRLFGNREYAQVVARADGRVVHRSHVFPRWFRFPFMERADLQIGDTWTDTSHRGKGLATAAIGRVLAEGGTRSGAYWYVVGRENLPSIRAIEKAGFTLVGIGERTRRMGVLVLGAYVIRRAIRGAFDAPSV